MTPFILDPRLAADTHPVAQWPLCELLLMDDAQYPWLILVPRVAGARELMDLDEATRVQLHRETDAAALGLRKAFSPHKLNVAALGNVVEQLHVHVIGRQPDDAAWPRPVWGAVPQRKRSAAERRSFLARLRKCLPGFAFVKFR